MLDVPLADRVMELNVKNHEKYAPDGYGVLLEQNCSLSQFEHLWNYSQSSKTVPAARHEGHVHPLHGRDDSSQFVGVLNMYGNRLDILWSGSVSEHLRSSQLSCPLHDGLLYLSREIA